MDEKLISVLIPVYNNIRYLNDSLDSLNKQTYKKLQIIVINDGSNNKFGLKKIIKKFEKKFKNICFINLKKNRGVSSALNKGLKRAKGKYISWLSHDDYYHPNFFHLQIKNLERYNNSVSFTNFYVVNKKKQIIKKNKFKNNFFELKHHVLFRDNINFCTFIFKKNVFRNLGQFDIKKKYTQDYDMLFKIIDKYRVVHLNEYLFYSRVHKNQDSQRFPSFAQLEKDKLYTSKISKIKNLYRQSGIVRKIYIVFFLKLKNLKNLNIKLKKMVQNDNIIFINILKIIFVFCELIILFRKKN